MSIDSMRACDWKAIIDKLNQDGPIEFTKEQREHLKAICDKNRQRLVDFRNLDFLDLYNNLDPIRDTSKFAICDSLGSFDGVLMVGEHPVATHGYVFKEKAVRKAQAACSKTIDPTTCKENVTTYFRELDSMDVSPSKESLAVIAKFREDVEERKAYIENLIEEERRDLMSGQLNRLHLKVKSFTVPTKPNEGVELVRGRPVHDVIPSEEILEKERAACDSRHVVLNSGRRSGVSYLILAAALAGTSNVTVVGGGGRSVGTVGRIEPETYAGVSVKGMDFSAASRKHKAQSYKQRRGKGDRKRDRDPMYANMFKRR